MIDNSYVKEKFQEQFGKPPQHISSAPGRVNLIGEHTDYNGGFVLPAAINREIRVAARPGEDKKLSLYSESFSESFSVGMENGLAIPGEKGWRSYFLAVVDQFLKKGFAVPGMDAYIVGDIPLGAGLSSSAALEVCVAALLNRLCNAGMNDKEIALLSRDAEHSDFVGVKCGVMDQLISSMGKKDHALLVDCYSVETTDVPFDSSKSAIVIINSMKKRGLVDSEYNRRREECEQGLNFLRQVTGIDFPSIRHIPLNVFEKHSAEMTENSRKRIRHNLTENLRVKEFVTAMEKDDFQKAGELLYQSHESLKNDFEVSCPELDAIVEIALETGGVYGCRMTGAGFGGCALALVKPGAAEEVGESVTHKFEKIFNVTPEIYISAPKNGAGVDSV